MEQNNFFLILATVFITIGLLALGAFGFWFFQQNMAVQNKPLASPSPLALATASPSALAPSPTPAAVVSSPRPSLMPSPSTSPADQLRQAFSQKYNKPVASVSLEINDLNDPYAKGVVRFSGEMGGGWFLAYKQNNEWIIVADGNGTIDCADIDPYNFPVAMVPECWDSASQTLITR